MSNESMELRALKLRSYRRRVRALRADIGIKPWPRDAMAVFIERLIHVAGEGIGEYDLRVLVRMYNRELVGRDQSTRGN